MSMQATGTFKVNDWKEEPFKEFEGESKLTRASVTQTFQGDIEGEGSVEYLMAYREDKTADFVGILYVEGGIDGRHGGFALQITGSFDGKVANGRWSIIPELGTKALCDLRGQGGFKSPLGTEASFTLDYDFERLADAEGKEYSAGESGE